MMLIFVMFIEHTLQMLPARSR